MNERPIGVLLVTNTETRERKEVVGNFFSLLKLVEYISIPMKAQAELDTLSGKHSLSIGVKNLSIFVGELTNIDIQSRAYRNALKGGVIKQEAGILGLTTGDTIEGGIDKAARGDYYTLKAAMEALADPLEALFGMESLFGIEEDPEERSFAIVGEDFELTLERPAEENLLGAVLSGGMETEEQFYRKKKRKPIRKYKQAPLKRGIKILNEN